MLRGLFLFATLVAASSSTAQTGRLAVRIDGLRGGGAVNMLVFHSGKGFPDTPDRAVQALRLPIGTNQSVLTHTVSLPYGTYAIAVFHDRNSNGKLDRYLFGAPREPYGFSNGARGVFSAPDFSEAAFSLGNNRQEVSVSVK